MKNGNAIWLAVVLSAVVIAAIVVVFVTQTNGEASKGNAETHEVGTLMSERELNAILTEFSEINEDKLVDVFANISEEELSVTEQERIALINEEYNAENDGYNEEDYPYGEKVDDELDALGY